VRSCGALQISRKTGYRWLALAARGLSCQDAPATAALVRRDAPRAKRDLWKRRRIRPGAAQAALGWSSLGCGAAGGRHRARGAERHGSPMPARRWQAGGTSQAARQRICGR